MDFQYYPTPKSLARFAIEQFTDRNPSRILEPSAGRGELAQSLKDSFPHHRMTIDCVELDLDNQSILRDKGMSVVGHDFLQYSGGPIYSHILMNPPFNQGDSHVLHAWDLLVDGEIVAIINAETLKNPYTRKRQLLARVIENHGYAEFKKGAFTCTDTKRKTDVEIAVVYLRKESDFNLEFLEKLQKDRAKEEHEEYVPNNDLALNDQFIANRVITFNCAVEAMNESIKLQIRADHYANMLGVSLAGEAGMHQPAKTHRTMYNKAYSGLKEAAWTSILRSTLVLERLGSAAQKRLQSEFEKITELAFTESNVYGFLEGLILQQGDLQTEMACDVFDQFSKYYPGNRVYYCGWKSNAKHRVNAFRLKMNRFILPGAKSDWYENSMIFNSICWEDERRFQDFDKVFAMLDGKTEQSIYGLVKLFREEGNFRRLVLGERLASDYFEVRFYPGQATFHLFPTNKAVLERLNRVVGKHRAWLPDEPVSEQSGFWQQYESAEKVNRKIKMTAHEEWCLKHGTDKGQAEASEKLRKQFEDGLLTAGITFDPDLAIERDDAGALPYSGVAA